MRLLLACAVVAAVAGVAAADPDPHRKVIVLEYRAGSSALPGIASRVVGQISKQTGLDVLSPDQTRAMYGEHLDQVIVKCAGEADCIAKIGAKVGAAEVVLVGVSELGDVILTMQRIDVGSHSVMGRVADSLAAGAPPNDSQLGQYLTRLLPPSDFVRFGVIAIMATEAGALVTVNKEDRGTTPIEPLKLSAPATYDIHVEKQGFLPFDTQIELPADSKLELPVRLQRPGGHVAWYQHWYVIAGVALIVAGATGGTILYEENKTATSVPVMGGIGTR
jgi:hypothetical protein|nr:PEGA domain-containing protein [Kofleriaceae bacterium]